MNATHRNAVAACVALAVIVGSVPASAAASASRIALRAGLAAATLVEPAPDSAADVAAPVFVVATPHGENVELVVNDRTVDAKRIGKQTLDTVTGETRRYYYGIELLEGPNRVALTPLDASGGRGDAEDFTVYGPGRPVSLAVTVDGRLTADGRTPATVTVAAVDRYGHHALPGSVVKVTLVQGDARFTTAVATSPTADVPAAAARPAEPRNALAVGDGDGPLRSIDVPLGAGGVATVPIVPGLQPGDLTLRAAYAEVSSDAHAFVSPALRKPVIVGIATAGVGSVPAPPGEDPTIADGANTRRGRIALYGTGTVANVARASVAYDTANVLDTRTAFGPFVDNPDERPYQTYGDASTRRDDALSRDHLYARVDVARSSAMWGEFEAQTGTDGGIGGYDRLVSGAKLELANKNARVVAFNAANDVAYARAVFTPSGLTNLGALLRPQIVVGSESITLVALDRHTGAVLSQIVLARNVDYTLDYGSGALRFIDPPLPYDAQFDPQQILVQYEYAGLGVNAETTGGRAQVAFGHGNQLHAAAGYVNDATGSGNFSLASQDVGGTLRGGTWSLGHVQAQGAAVDDATTVTSLAGGNSSGNAYTANASTAIGRERLEAAFETTSAGFNNPFGGLATPGLLTYHASLTHPLGTTDRGELTFAFDHEQNLLPAARSVESSANVKLHERVTRRFSVDAGLALRSVSGSQAFAVTTVAPIGPIGPIGPTPVSTTATPQQNPSGGLAQAQLGFAWQALPTVKFSANRQQDLGGVTDLSEPTETTAQIDVDLAKKGRLYLRQLWSATPTQSFAAATSQLTSIASATRSTAIGIERSLGNATTVDDEYGIDHTGNGDDVYSAIGVRERVAIGRNLHGDLTFQRANSSGPAAAGFNLYGMSLAYDTSRLRATASYQLRTGAGSGSTLDTGAAGALGRDLSLFASVQTSNNQGYNIVDDRISLALRPEQSTRFVSLFGFEAKHGDLVSIGERTQLLSLEELVRPLRGLEIAGRYAYKLDGDAYYPAQTSLFGVRITQRITKRFDVGAETRLLRLANAPEAGTTGFAIESGLRLGDQFRLAGGYNFSGSPDPALAAAPTRRGFYATATTLIDRFFGYGK